MAQSMETRMEGRLINVACLIEIAVLGSFFPAIAGDAAGGVLAQGRSPDSHLAQRNSNCRRIVAERAIAFYYRPAMNGGSSGSLAQGDQVELLNAPDAIQGDDGRMYFHIRHPFNRRDQSTGYILSRYELENGETRPTLGICQKRMW